MVDRNDDGSWLLDVGWYVDVHPELGGPEVEVVDLGGSLCAAQCGEASGREHGDKPHLRRRPLVMRTKLGRRKTEILPWQIVTGYRAFIGLLYR